MATEVFMPSLGESVFEGTISIWLKKEGDKVERYEPILEIETDKVTTEATAEITGTLLKIVAKEGETVAVGSILAFIGNPEEDVNDLISDRMDEATVISTSEKLTPVEPARSPLVQQPTSNGPAQPQRQRYSGRVSPVVGRIAGEHNVDLNLITGTGRDGRITKKDILAFIEVQEPDDDQAPNTATTSIEPSSPSSLGALPGEILALSNMRRAIADHMVRSKHTSPHVTTVFDVDFTNVASHRAENRQRFSQDGANLTFTAYIVAALVQALKTHPIANSTWTESGILLKKEINLGMATAIADGLIVPIIKNADGLSLLGIARAVNDLADRARMGQLLPDEVQGGTFTLTNHGTSGSLFATPIINQPQCAIMGLGKIEKRVKVIEDAIAIRLMAYVSLTFDHRILDGATADGFVSTFKEIIEKYS
ncbi:MAG TPA: dihydrolipoamide acetyltransferase family protein [Patescibacteria group bacterium]|jgi:2-oxoglutarate dehydrogenase E2 component (dihydrolipoamide succinyltransferase)|nr:dihydrolipoamide acetyltransferase family protein [Patescibacteria group bacterium]